MRVVFNIHGICLCAILLSLSISIHALEQTEAAGVSSYQVGGWGDGASRDSLGVHAEIRTNVYPISANSNHGDAFWIGSNLANGAFIQFGYTLVTPNQTCSTTLPDAHVQPQICIQLFWEYWPNMTGTTAIEGIMTFTQPTTFDLNGTWHSYEIVPTSDGAAWSFKFDGQPASTAPFKSTHTSSPLYVEAEQVTTEEPQRLGPVEFRNMTCLKSDGWHSVGYITASVTCSKNPGFKRCETPNPYGVEAVGPNHIIAGSGIEGPRDGRLLWVSPIGAVLLFWQEISFPAILLALLIAGGGTVALVIQLRQNRRKRAQC